jgi:hypothetical protein
MKIFPPLENAKTNPIKPNFYTKQTQIEPNFSSKTRPTNPIKPNFNPKARPTNPIKANLKCGVCPEDFCGVNITSHGSVI